MSTDLQNKQVVKHYIETIVNTGNIDKIADFIAPDYEEVYNNQRYQLGIDGAKEHIIGVRKTYPDLHLSIEQQIAEGEWVATCYTMRGTHAGEWMNIQPTGKRIEVTGVNIDRVKDGKIVEHGGAANLFEAFLGIEVIQFVNKM
ncbi:MAG: ester cyclase [Saprospiraceae bacterium]